MEKGKVSGARLETGSGLCGRCGAGRKTMCSGNIRRFPSKNIPIRQRIPAHQDNNQGAATMERKRDTKPVMQP